MRRAIIGLMACASMAIVRPVAAECLVFPLESYLDTGRSVTSQGDWLHDCQLALVKISTVRPAYEESHGPLTDASGHKLSAENVKTFTSTLTVGRLELQKIDSSGEGLPRKFEVTYRQRGGLMEDCETWDHIDLKPGEELLMFVRKEKGN